MTDNIPSLPEEGIITSPDRNPNNETLSILGKPVAASSLEALQSYIKSHKYDPNRHNLALIVIEAMTQLGINRFEDKLLDLGTEQTAVSGSQTINASFQKAFALLEENASFDSKTGKAAFPADFFKKNKSSFNAMLKGIYQLFFNQSGSDSTNTTPSYDQIKIYLPKPGGGYRVIEPYYTSNHVTKINPTDFKLVNNMIDSVNSFMFGKMDGNHNIIPHLPSPQNANQHMPIFQYIALAMLQVTVDDNDKDYVDKSGNFLPQYKSSVEKGTFFTQLFGNPSTYAGLQALQGIATVFTDKYKPDSEYLLAKIQSEGAKGTLSYTQFEDPLADMMADFLSSKSSSTGGQAPLSGFVDVGHGTGQFDNISVYSDAQNAFSQAGTLLQSMTQIVASKTQSYTSMITNFNQITQSVTAGVNSAIKDMTQNQQSR